MDGGGRLEAGNETSEWLGGNARTDGDNMEVRIKAELRQVYQYSQSEIPSWKGILELGNMGPWEHRARGTLDFGKREP